MGWFGAPSREKGGITIRGPTPLLSSRTRVRVASWGVIRAYSWMFLAGTSRGLENSYGDYFGWSCACLNITTLGTFSAGPHKGSQITGFPVCNVFR